MSNSPYYNVPEENWLAVTEQLLSEHPLSPKEVLEVALISWSRLWSTRVGDSETGFALTELNVPSTVVGYFFEKLFTKELGCRYPDVWAGGSGSQKDLHCKTDESKSVEIKTSGQLGLRIFGNRSYGQKVALETQKKDKSGYYITVNFFETKLLLVRFGWIDADDWQAQKSQTGQMAGLKESVYRYKLRPIRGSYMLEAPVCILEQVGGQAVAALAKNGIYSIKDLILAPDKEVPERYRNLVLATRSRYENLL